jgi:3-phenylpropionate/trans-cinnamate dioxygenase ferredoxin subunit
LAQAQFDTDLYEFISFAEVSDLPPGERLYLDVGEIPVVIINLAGRYFAIADICTHDDGPLGDGDIDGCEIICPRHGARFDLNNGDALSLPAIKATKVFPVRERGGKLEIGVLRV